MEEVVFRGVIQEYLQKKLICTCRGPVSYQNLITSLIFVGFHFVNHTIVWALSVFIPSMIFGYFKDKYNKLLPSIILHCFYNAGYYLF